MDIEDSSDMCFMIECTEDLVAKPDPGAVDEPSLARQKLLDKSVGTPKDKALCKSFKQMCDFAKGPVYELPKDVKTHLGGVYWLEFPDAVSKDLFLKSGILDPLTVVPKSNPMAVGGPPKNIYLL